MKTTILFTSLITATVLSTSAFAGNLWHPLRQRLADHPDRRRLGQRACRQWLQRVGQRLQVAADLSDHVRAAAALRPRQAEPGSLDRATVLRLTRT